MLGVIGFRTARKGQIVPEVRFGADAYSCKLRVQHPRAIICECVCVCAASSFSFVGGRLSEKRTNFPTLPHRRSVFEPTRDPSLQSKITNVVVVNSGAPNPGDDYQPLGLVGAFFLFSFSCVSSHGLTNGELPRTELPACRPSLLSPRLRIPRSLRIPSRRLLGFGTETPDQYGWKGDIPRNRTTTMKPWD